MYVCMYVCISLSLKKVFTHLYMYIYTVYRTVNSDPSRRRRVERGEQRRDGRLAAENRKIYVRLTRVNP